MLHVAADLFAAHGYDGTSIQQIARAAGYTTGAIYGRFESKSSLLLEVVKYSISHLPAVGGPVDGATGAQTIGDLLIALASPQLHRVRQLTMELHAAARTDPEVARLLTEFSQRRIEEIADVVRGEQPARAGAEGERVDAVGTASVILMLMVGISHIETISPALLSDDRWRREIPELVQAIMTSMKDRYPEADASG